MYCAAVTDTWSRRIIGWSIAEHMRTELVTDAPGMAPLRRNPQRDNPAFREVPADPIALGPGFTVRSRWCVLLGLGRRGR